MRGEFEQGNSKSLWKRKGLQQSNPKFESCVKMIISLLTNLVNWRVGGSVIHETRIQEFKGPKPSFLIDRLFKEEPRVFPTNVSEVSTRKDEVQEDIMICFPQVALFEDDCSDLVHGSMDEGEPDQESWTHVPFKKRSSVTEGRSGRFLRDNRTFKEVTRRASRERGAKDH
ncbi:hypothetical protein COP1_008888 [Malus domestica]